MANTDFKLDDYQAVYPSDQYDFTFPSGFQPANERVAAQLSLQNDHVPSRDLNYCADYGLGPRIISLQGEDLDDDDQYLLRNSIENPRIKKLFLGDDYYYYVRGLDLSLVRSEARPALYSYVASFIAYDPYMYDNNSIQTDTASSYIINLSTTDGTQGYSYVEPIIWLDNCGSDAGYIQDHRGCRLQFTPPDDDVWVIMPYYNARISGFMPDYPVAYKWARSGGSISDSSTYFGLDAIHEGSSQYIKNGTHGTDYSTDITLSTQNTDGVDYNVQSLYPRAEFGRSNTFTVATWAGTVHIQWRYRR